MSDKKYVVPDGMLSAVNDASEYAQTMDDTAVVEILEAALRWLAENAPKPERSQCEEMWRAAENDGERYCQEWVRRMFLAPDPEVPDAVKDLLWARRVFDPIVDDAPEKLQEMHDKWILEAYKRGRSGK